MNAALPSRIRRGIERAALLGVLGVLVWQLGAGVWRMQRQFGDAIRTPGMFDSEAERVARAFGDRHAAYALLRDRTPETAIVYCNLLRGHDQLEGGVEDAFLLNRLRHALHPRFVLGLDFRDPRSAATLPADKAAWTFEVGGRRYDSIFVCDFRPELAGDPPPPLELVEATQGFELWAVRK